MATSIFWYDLETTGTQPSRDRPLQVAGIRTTEDLEEIDEPLNLYCQLPDDILPHPEACLVTGITPEQLKQQGLREAAFTARLHQELAKPGTCTAGYNSVRFDDEITRYTLYRNFYDPYAREWQGGNSRWDIIDLVRAAYALRPEGLVWPKEQGRISMRLEHLTQANGLAHEQAHDALSDVRATIALARLLRQRQPRLYQYAYALRRKTQVQEHIQLLQPLVHISGRFSGERHYLAVVLPLAWHPTNKNALIVCDLHSEALEQLWQLPAETLHERLYSTHESLTKAGLASVPLKLLHINRCPMVAPLKVLRPQDQKRLQLNLDVLLQRADHLRQHQLQWSPVLEDLYRIDTRQSVQDSDPEQALYQGFLNEGDRRQCERIRAADACSLMLGPWTFSDPRLPELLFRYRARNFPNSLSQDEQSRWLQFCHERLSIEEKGAPLTLTHFEQALEKLPEAKRQSSLIQSWQTYIQALRQRYGLITNPQ